MKFRYFIFGLFSFVVFSSFSSAAVCDVEQVKRLKELAKQLEINYEYIDSDIENMQDDAEAVVNSYLVTVNLLSDELYLMYDDVRYDYNEGENGVIRFAVNAGKVVLTIHSTNCIDYKLRTVTENLKRYNTYSSSYECKELAKYELEICDPWYQGVINDDIFYEKVNKYLKKDEEKKSDFVYFLNRYGFYIILIILVLLLIIFGIKKYKKRRVLE